MLLSPGCRNRGRKSVSTFCAVTRPLSSQKFGFPFWFFRFPVSQRLSGLLLQGPQTVPQIPEVRVQITGLIELRVLVGHHLRLLQRPCPIHLRRVATVVMPTEGAVLTMPRALPMAHRLVPTVILVGGIVCGSVHLRRGGLTPLTGGGVLSHLHAKKTRCLFGDPSSTYAEIAVISSQSFP